jgi:hypothetical protein
MRIFSFLTRLMPIGKLISIVKWLKTQKGWFYPIVGVKFFTYLIQFLIKAESLRFMKVVRYIYYFLSAFNVVLALIIITNFSDFTNPELIKFFITSLELLIPVIILEGLSEYIEEIALFFKNILKNFIDWVYDKEALETGDKSTKKENTSPRIPTQDQFSYKASDLEFNEFGDLSTFRGEENRYLNWISIAILTFAIFGISYTLHPELYHSVYSNLKDLFFPGRGGGGDAVGGVNTPQISPNLVLKNTVDRIVNDNTLSDIDKANRVNALARTVLSQVHTITPQDKLEKVGILAEAIRIIDDANDTISLASSSPSISANSLTPTNNTIPLPSTSASTTPTNVTTSLPSTSASTTPTNVTTSLPHPNLQISVASTTPDLISLDHSPILERIPSDLDWAAKGGGELKEIISNLSSSVTTPVAENTIPIPIPSKPVDLDKMMEELNKK